MALPGALEDKAPPPLAVRPPPPLQSKRKSHERCPLYTARIWEHGGDAWHEKHRFCAGLEVDLADSPHGVRGVRKELPTAQVEGKVHLPSTSLQALLALEASLAPETLMLDTAGNSKMQLRELFIHLMTSLEKNVPTAALQEAKSLLHKHPYSSVKDYPSSTAVEDGEAVDIFVCCCNSLDPGAKPLLLLSRMALCGTDGLQVKDDDKGKMHFCSVILCGAAETSLGQELAEALATMFMDEEFVTDARRAEKDQPERVIQALTHYLSTLTIVPTVHMAKEDAEVAGAGNVLLQDSLVDEMQKIMSTNPAQEKQSDDPQMRRAGAESRVSRSLGSAWLPNHVYCVEADKLSLSGDWQVELRLRSGLELDVASGEARPHLPHVSVAGLQEVKRLIGHTSAVAVDVAAASAGAAVSAAVGLLSSAGLHPKVANEVTGMLLDRATRGVKGSSFQRQISVDATTELVSPIGEDEACLVLTVLSNQVPEGSSMMAAFLRLKAPLVGAFASTQPAVRFLTVLVAPRQNADRAATVTAALAALVADEDLMTILTHAKDASSFIRAFERRLNNLVLMPHTHLHNRHSSQDEEVVETPRQKLPEKIDTQVVHETLGFDIMHKEHVEGDGWRRHLGVAIQLIQKYAIPLVTGVLIAMVWVNVDEESYMEATHHPLFEGWNFWGHDVSMHFIVNDFFMCFFFGLAIKEVTEALLPGGSLSPLSRAANPLLATLGGVVGPVVAYVIMIYLTDALGGFDGQQCQATDVTEGAHRLLAGSSSSEASSHTVPCTFAQLINGWGVPTATDISLAWMFALLIFGAGHPAINFLLLLAIADDALGMAIIAIAYPPPDHPVEPVWLLLVLGGSVVAFAMRKASVQFWWPYVFIAGPICWLGLIKAQVHPALALVFVVPFMPAHHIEHVQSTSGALGFASRKVQYIADHLPQRANDVSIHAAHWVAALEGAPLHAFEHHLKLPVDLGMFWFGLANAGVKVSALGGVTTSVIFALTVGKTLGISCFALAAHALGFSLPAGLSKIDVFALAALGGVGLTVALFVSNQAFTDPGLQSQAKMGAVLSTVSAAIAWLIKVLGDKFFPTSKAVSEFDGQTEDVEACAAGDEDEDEARDWLDDLAVDDIMQVLWMQRRYQARGTKMPIEKVARSISKSSSVQPSTLSTPRLSTPRTGMNWSLEAQTAWGISPSPRSSRRPSREASARATPEGSRPSSGRGAGVVMHSPQAHSVNSPDNWQEPSPGTLT